MRRPYCDVSAELDASWLGRPNGEGDGGWLAVELSRGTAPILVDLLDLSRGACWRSAHELDVVGMSADPNPYQSIGGLYRECVMVTTHTSRPKCNLSGHPTQGRVRRRRSLSSTIRPKHRAAWPRARVLSAETARNWLC